MNKLQYKFVVDGSVVAIPLGETGNKAVITVHDLKLNEGKIEQFSVTIAPVSEVRHE